MIFELFDINGNAVHAENIVSYELISEAGAACDGLRLNFIQNSLIGEICTVKAYIDSVLIFNGFCDKQKISMDKSGVSCFIYARSSAALLVDNEALPCQYSKPSARQLWYSNARDFGFECALPEIYTENNYLVSKGTSCYGAINDFVSAVYGAPVYATPDNVLTVYKESEYTKSLNDYNVVSFSYIINRSEPVSEIDYKISSGDDYSYHFKSDYADRMGIKRRRLYNLSSIPLWQRETTAEKKIKDSLEEYYSVSAEISGECDLKLYDRVIFNFAVNDDNEEFYVSELIRSKGKGGEKTAIVLKKKINGELVNYVA